jgi:hypothetical protein
VGTITIRLAGQYVLHPGRVIETVILYAISFAVMAFLTPRILGHDARATVTLLMLPTLTFDAFGCVFFPSLYPNLPPAAAGLFGGWMLIFCGGAAAGVWLRR